MRLAQSDEPKKNERTAPLLGYVFGIALNKCPFAWIWECDTLLVEVLIAQVPQQVPQVVHPIRPPPNQTVVQLDLLPLHEDYGTHPVFLHNIYGKEYLVESKNVPACNFTVKAIRRT
jgi:hypothetical protein